MFLGSLRVWEGPFLAVCMTVHPGSWVHWMEMLSHISSFPCLPLPEHQFCQGGSEQGLCTAVTPHLAEPPQQLDEDWMSCFQSSHRIMATSFTRAGLLMWSHFQGRKVGILPGIKEP